MYVCMRVRAPRTCTSEGGEQGASCLFFGRRILSLKDSDSLSHKENLVKKEERDHVITNGFHSNSPYPKPSLEDKREPRND